MVKRTFFFKYIILFCCFVWPTLFVWQGLDVTDMGYWLTGYQQFDYNPSCMGSCWLSLCMGHWVGWLFGDTVIVYKLAFVGVQGLIAYWVWRVLGSLFGYSSFLAGLVLLVVMFATRSADNWIGYNNLTAVFYVAGGALLYNGLNKYKWHLILLAGTVLGANIFVRFPNLFGASLVAAIWLWAWGKQWSLKKTAIWTGIFVAGLFIGIAIVFTGIEFYGHRQTYLSGLTDLLGMAGDTNSHHSGGLLLKMLAVDHIMSMGIGVCSVGLGAWVAYQTTKTRSYFTAIIVICASIGLSLASFCYVGYVKWAVPGFCFTVLSLAVFREIRRDPSLAVLAFVAGMILFLAPLGSGNGIHNAIYGMYLALPLSLLLVWQGKSVFWGRAASDNKSGRILATTIMLALSIHTVRTAWFYTYRDNKDRFAMTSKVKHPKLIATHTTEARAKAVTEVIDELRKHVVPGAELLAYNSIGLMHFITETSPWLDSSWPDLMQPEKLESLIIQNEAKHEHLPVVVRARVDTRSFDWPAKTIQDGNNMRESRNRDIIQSFLTRQHYSSVWTNTAFEILTTD